MVSRLNFKKTPSKFFNKSQFFNVKTDGYISLNVGYRIIMIFEFTIITYLTI